MTPAAWTLLLYMGGAAHGGPVALPMADETACRAAFAGMVAEHTRRRDRAIQEKQGAGWGPSYSAGLCVETASGRVVAAN